MKKLIFQLIISLIALPLLGWAGPPTGPYSDSETKQRLQAQRLVYAIQEGAELGLKGDAYAKKFREVVSCSGGNFSVDRSLGDNLAIACVSPRLGKSQIKIAAKKLEDFGFSARSVSGKLELVDNWQQAQIVSDNVLIKTIIKLRKDVEKAGEVETLGESIRKGL